MADMTALASCSSSDVDEELSVGGTTPPPLPTDTEDDTKSHDDDDRKGDVEQADDKPLPPIRFSIENILNPNFGKTSPLVNAANNCLASLNLAAFPGHPLGLFQANFGLIQAKTYQQQQQHPLHRVSQQLASSAIDLSVRNPLKTTSTETLSQSRRQNTSPVNKVKNPSLISSSTSSGSSSSSSVGSLPDDTNATSASKGNKLPDPGKLDPAASTQQQNLWPAWVYCTRYSDRPSSGPRVRRVRKSKDKSAEEKRPRTAFTAEQLGRLKSEFTENRYLTEKRRQDLARELCLHENQIKIWFQNKRAKIKKASGQKNPLALQLMAQGLYNHTTIPVDEDEEEDLQD